MPIITSPIDTLPSPGIDAGLMPVGAAWSLDTIAKVINAAWDQGNLKATDVDSKITALTNALNTTPAPSISSTAVTSPSVTEPAVAIPESVEVGDAISRFDSKYLELVAMLANKFTAFRTEYFPDENTLYAAAEDWLHGALANPEGLPTAVINALMTDAEATILSDSARASDAVMQAFAAKGFPLPPGAAASATLQIQQKAQGEMANTRRKLIITSIEQMRFNIQQTLNLRQMAMQAAVQYIQALASGPDLASKAISLGYDAQSKLISAASQFYNSRIAAAELVAKTGQFNAANSLQAAEKNQAAQMQIIENKLKALLSEVQALAQMATSLFNNVHASAGTGYSFSMS